VTRGQLPEGRVARPNGGGAAAAVPPHSQVSACTNVHIDRIILVHCGYWCHLLFTLAVGKGNERLNYSAKT